MRFVRFIPYLNIVQYFEYVIQQRQSADSFSTTTMDRPIYGICFRIA